MRNISKFLNISLFLITLINSGNAQKSLSIQDLNTKKLKPAILYWDFGSPEYLTIETIYPTQDSINSYWNVTHRSPAPDNFSGNGFDYYLVNENGLKPVISQMYHIDFINYLIHFENDSAMISIKTTKDTTDYKIKTPEFIAPEGPGTSLFLGSLPLSKNYHINYYELNRWSGKIPNTGKIELTELRVVGEDKLKIDEKYFDTYRVNVTTLSGRFTEIWVLKNSPHYSVKINHRIDDKKTMKSQVVKLFITN